MIRWRTFFTAEHSSSINRARLNNRNHRHNNPLGIKELNACMLSSSIYLSLYPQLIHQNIYQPISQSIHPSNLSSIHPPVRPCIHSFIQATIICLLSRDSNNGLQYCHTLTQDCCSCMVVYWATAISTFIEHHSNNNWNPCRHCLWS